VYCGVFLRNEINIGQYQCRFAVWKLRHFGRMERRRRKSKEAAIFESITGLTGLGLFLWIFSPGFRLGIQILLLVLVIVALIALVIWLAHKLFAAEEPSLAFKTSTSNAHLTEDPIRKKRPTVYVEELKYTHRAPDLTISEKLRKIDWFQFEKLMELIYRQRGFTVSRLGGANPDGGVDLIVKSPSETFAVQCKHWRTWTVGVKEIREFLGALTDSGIPKGIFITLTGYSGQAKELADKHGIQILNESDIVQMLEKSELMYSQEVSGLFSDERKFCPRCEKEMVLRTARVKGNQFWGCSNYPRCKFILNYVS
jgi:HJR/Mrr/RecB family endonuclease